MWHLLWQMLLKTNKKGTVDKFLNSRLVLDHICQTANTVGPTVSDFPFLPSFLIPVARPCRHSMCVYGYSSVITLEVQNTWHKGLWEGFVGSDQSQYLQFWLPKSLLQNTVQFFSNKTIISDGTLWCLLPILLPSGSRKEARRRMQSYIYNWLWDSWLWFLLCQPDSCPDVSVWMFSARVSVNR